MADFMDRALKERIVGAVVLVVLAVLVVPVFLDGPADDAEVVSESVTLPGQNRQPRRQQTIVLDRDRSEPVPPAADSAAAGTDSPPGDEQPAPADGSKPPVEAEAARSAREPAAEVQKASAEKEQAPPAPQTSSTGMWAVQLGSFSRPDNAERLAANLRDEGYAAFLSRLEGADGPLHRVRIGPQKDRDSAEKTAARLAADGHKGQVVPHP